MSESTDMFGQGFRHKQVDVRTASLKNLGVWVAFAGRMPYFTNQACK